MKMRPPIIWGERDERTRREAVTNIIQSVALQEAALAHILEAEQEKMLAVIGGHHVTTQELFELNKSVESMIEAITRLESMLQAKLELFKDCLCEAA